MTQIQEAKDKEKATRRAAKRSWNYLSLCLRGIVDASLSFSCLSSSRQEKCLYLFLASSFSLSFFHAPYFDLPSDKALSESIGEALLGDTFSERQSSWQGAVRATTRPATKL
jgi:hypothetical protein